MKQITSSHRIDDRAYLGSACTAYSTQSIRPHCGHDPNMWAREMLRSQTLDQVRPEFSASEPRGGLDAPLGFCSNMTTQLICNCRYEVSLDNIQSISESYIKVAFACDEKREGKSNDSHSMNFGN